MIGARTSAAGAAGLVYIFAYLYMLGDIGLGVGGWELRVSSQWPTLWLKARAPFRFEGVAMVEAGLVRWIVSPLNLAIAVVLGGLLAANVHGAIALRQHPPACRAPGLGAGAAVAAPALLAGGACCAPALVLLLGLPTLGAFAGLFTWLVPVAALALAATRFWQRATGAPRWGPGLRRGRAEAGGPGTKPRAPSPR